MMGDKRISLLSLSIFLWASLSPVWATVWYDNKAILINGQRKILISGSIHYPRSTPEMWPDLLKKAKEGGIDVIQTYVFWNGHEPTRGNFNFAGRYDLVKFIRLAQQAGLYVHLRIGPYVCAEWNFGGFPVWLKYIPNIQFRTDNEPFKAEMYKFTAKIVSMMKSEKLFQPQGGPIIMSQIENEYGPIEWELKAPGKAYTKWFSQMAIGLNTDVPWIMCKQEDAPGPIIDACNGFYCDGYTPNANNKPKMWTEAWTSWFTEIGKPVPYRPVEDLAFGVARFFQKGGSYINYYMYHGGTNFDRTSGLFVATSYDYDAPIDEYGLLREPKWGHLRDLHKAIKQCEPALVSANPTVTWPGKNLEITVYNSKSGCAAFLANYDPSSWARVMYQNHPYDLAPWSVSILPDCKTVVFNTAKVNVPRYHPKMTPVSGEFPWQSYIEQPVVADDRDVFTKNWLVEQKQTTWDTSDYLWYTTNVFIKSGDWKSGSQPTLSVNSAGHVLHVFVNGQKAGTVYGSLKKPSVTFNSAVKLQTGLNKISLLSVTVGLPNVDVYFDTWNAGVLGPVTLNGLNGGTWDLGKQKWSYEVGLRGEGQKLYTFSGSSSVKWSGGSWLAKKGPLTWYKTSFDAPWGNEPLALDMYTMGKGRIWINGESIGRHWSGSIAHGNCGNCSYNGLFNENKCLAGCGEPSQRWYHIPRSWLKPKGNFMVILEESGGDPSGIRLVKRTTS